MEKGDPKRNYSVESVKLHLPNLEVVADVIKHGLLDNFEFADCIVVQCPDLTMEPFGLAAPGLCGKTRLVEIGGVPNLLPNNKHMQKVYDLKVVQHQIDLPGAFMLGAGAGSKHVIGCNCEFMPNVWLEKCQNLSHISKVDTSDDTNHILEKYQPKCHECGLMCNLFCSEGKAGKIFKIYAKRRTGEENLVSCIRKTLKAKYGDLPVGLGGVFVVKNGSIKIHVMSDFIKTPIKTEEQLNNWLKFYNAKSPFMCLSTLCSTEPTRKDDRIEHTHGYSLVNGEGGHYHEDTTPDEIEYMGYYSMAESFYRLDRPKNAHCFE